MSDGDGDSGSGGDGGDGDGAVYGVDRVDCLWRDCALSKENRPLLFDIWISVDCRAGGFEVG